MSDLQQWERDLAAVRSGDMMLDDLSRAHPAVIRRFARAWRGAARYGLDMDDIEQEILIEVWRSIEKWNEADGMPLHLWVAKRNYWRVANLVQQRRRAQAREEKFGQMQLVTETVVPWRFKGESRVVPIGIAEPLEYRLDYRRRAARFLGQLPSIDARFLCEVLRGRTIRAAAIRVYTSHKDPYKAARRTVARVRALVEGSLPRTQITKETSRHAAPALQKTRLKPIAKASNPHPCQGFEGHAAS